MITTAAPSKSMIATKNHFAMCLAFGPANGLTYCGIDGTSALIAMGLTAVQPDEV